MSSNAIEFGYSDDSEEEEDDEETEDDDENSDEDASDYRASSPEKGRRTAMLARRVKYQRSFRTVLYISMEYCEKRVGPILTSPPTPACKMSNLGTDSS